MPTLRRDHLVVLLNELYALGTDRVAVAHPADEVGTLFTVELGEGGGCTVRFDQGLLTYGDNRGDVRQRHGEQAFEELPQKESYGRALVGSGLAALENADDVDAFLRRYGYVDLAAGHQPVVAGIDTNVMAWGVPSMLGIDPADQDGDGPKPIDAFALSEGVYDELYWHYEHYDTHRLVDAFGPTYDRLDDQPGGADREGFLGHREYRRLRDRPATDAVPGDRGDEAIVEAYREYDDATRKRLLLFSNDHGFVERATDAGLYAHHLAFPVDVDRTVRTDWDTVADALYLLAVVFGVLELPRVTLYGVWNDKSSTDWDDERIDVHCRSSQIEPRLERHRAILAASE